MLLLANFPELTVEFAWICQRCFFEWKPLIEKVEIVELRYDTDPCARRLRVARNRMAAKADFAAIRRCQAQAKSSISRFPAAVMHFSGRLAPESRRLWMHIRPF